MIFGLVFASYLTVKTATGMAGGGLTLLLLAFMALGTIWIMGNLPSRM